MFKLWEKVKVFSWMCVSSIASGVVVFLLTFGASGSIFKVTAWPCVCNYYITFYTLCPQYFKQFFCGWLSNLDVLWPWTESWMFQLFVHFAKLSRSQLELMYENIAFCILCIQYFLNYYLNGSLIIPYQFPPEVGSCNKSWRRIRFRKRNSVGWCTVWSAGCVKRSTCI